MIKFGFGVLQATAPDRTSRDAFRFGILLPNGFVIGIFVGKSAIYAHRYRRRATILPDHRAV